MQWSAALLLILPLALAVWAARRPGPAKLLLAVPVTLALDFVTFVAFWLQAEWRSSADTVRLVLFLAVPVAIITFATGVALARGIALALNRGQARPRWR